MRDIGLVNLEKQHLQYNFAVNGGDIRAATLGLSMVFIPFIALGIGFYFMGDQIISQDYHLYVWIALGVSFLVILILRLKKMSEGASARFVVTVDLESAEIKAYDRVSMQNLWVSDFYPEQLQISEVMVEINGEDFRYPALVYANESLEIVEESVPYPERVILGYDEREAIEDVLRLIQEDIAQL